MEYKGVKVIRNKSQIVCLFSASLDSVSKLTKYSGCNAPCLWGKQGDSVISTSAGWHNTGNYATVAPALLSALFQQVKLSCAHTHTHTDAEHLSVEAHPQTHGHKSLTDMGEPTAQEISHLTALNL